MKSVLLFLVSIPILSFTFLGKDENENIESKVRQLLSKMTLEEKVGQMTQVTLDVVQKPRKEKAVDSELDLYKVREAVVKYHVGSILNTGGAANSLNGWHKIITGIEDVATKETRLKIPVLYGVDAIHGANYIKEGTLFPHAIAMAATRNTALMEEGAHVTAMETRASGVPWNFNPVLGLGRNPLWARFFETFGEDVYLVSEMGKAYVRGLQGKNLSDDMSAAACMKHYLGYSFPLNGLDRTPSWIPERMLREMFLVPFEEAIKAGALTLMVSSGEINGIPTHSDKIVLTDILKGELEFEGFTVSDWEDIKRLYDRDKVASSPKEAVKLAVMSGLDMSMVPYDYSFYNYLLELVKEGEVPLSRIDDAVTRILRVKFKLGLFDNPYPVEGTEKNVATEENRASSLNAAREAITLLKNENEILPIKKGSKILLTGPSANLMQVLNGGWSYTWQGNEEELYPEENNTLLEALQNKFGRENVTYVEGTSFEEDINSDAAVEKAKDADVIIAALGEPPYCETLGNIVDLNLSEAQKLLVRKLSKTGKPIVMVLLEGRPRLMSDIVDLTDGIIMGYLPGNFGGDALADIIAGDVNPSGKLPFTWARNNHGFTCYDHKPMEEFDVNKYDPLFDFGFGLSYTTFNYSDLIIDKKSYSPGESIEVSVKVTNTGKTAGKEAVELYLTDKIGSVSRPVKQLKRFTKIELKPNREKIIRFTLNPNDLSFIGRDNKRITEPGAFTVQIGKLKEEFNLLK